MSNEMNPSGEMQTALIQLNTTTMNDFENIIRVVETEQGRVLHSFPPHILVALLPPGKLSVLQNIPAVQSVETSVVSDEQINQASPQLQPALQAWNNLLNVSKQQATQSGPNLSWDAPGRLPPDPPAHIQEMLRQREREAGSE